MLAMKLQLKVVFAMVSVEVLSLCEEVGYSCWLIVE
jgi:hypothetical protein